MVKAILAYLLIAGIVAAILFAAWRFIDNATELARALTQEAGKDEKPGPALDLSGLATKEDLRALSKKMETKVEVMRPVIRTSARAEYAATGQFVCPYAAGAPLDQQKLAADATRLAESGDTTEAFKVIQQMEDGYFKAHVFAQHVVVAIADADAASAASELAESFHAPEEQSTIYSELALIHSSLSRPFQAVIALDKAAKARALLRQQPAPDAVQPPSIFSPTPGPTAPGDDTFVWPDLADDSGKNQEQTPDTEEATEQEPGSQNVTDSANTTKTVDVPEKTKDTIGYALVTYVLTTIFAPLLQGLGIVWIGIPIANAIGAHGLRKRLEKD